MNHQRFKFYHHSTEYYRQLYNSIKQLEDSCKDINYTVLPSTINYNRKSKFIKSNSNTNKTHKKVMWVQVESSLRLTLIITISLMRLIILIILIWDSTHHMTVSR